MKTDESGAPWPYEPVDPPDDNPGVPTWECPGGTCECHPGEGEASRNAHKILFYDPEAKRMPGARCRVLENGELINKEHPYADGGAGVPVKIRASTRVLEVEWVPASLPVGPGYPYRKRYYLDLGDDSDQGVHRRLHNIGFSAQPTLDDNIRDFQRAYLQAPTGKVEHVETELAVFHDKGMLPPLPRSSDANAKAQPVDAKAPPGTVGGPGAAPGGVGPQGAVTAIQKTILRVRVRTRANRGIKDATVYVDVGSATPVERKTDDKGFIHPPFVVDKDVLDEASPANTVVIRAKNFHHGPEPLPADPVKPGEIKVRAVVEPGRGFADVQPDIDPLDPSTPGIQVDTTGRFLDLVLRDAGMNQGAVSPNVTRRMTDDEVRRELIYDHAHARITLTADSEFQFNHDRSTGEFGACTANCVISKPAPKNWVALKPAVISGVTWFQLNSFIDNPVRSDDDSPADRYTRDWFGFGRKAQLSRMDQRHVVGLCRMCGELNERFGIVACYTQGMEGGGPNKDGTPRTDAHGYGMAVDFGGLATELPFEKGTRRSVKLGVDFVVFYHWGRIGMWDPAHGITPPTEDTARLPEGKVDTPDFETGKDGHGHAIKNFYRLDPPPFQQDDVLAKPEISGVGPHLATARDLFKAVFEIAVREYSDADIKLGPGTDPPPTAIDANKGHNTIHPDYGQPNSSGNVDGRQAHQNHLHIQLGPNKHDGIVRTE